MHRQIFLLRYPSFPFKDHWALWIPSTLNPQIGTKIQVEGDVRHGFTHQIERNFDLEIDGRRIHLTPLGQVPDEHVHETPSIGESTEDATPRDDIERHALSIAAPGPSMNAASEGNAPPAQRVDFSDCQWWLRQVVAKLVQKDILPASAIAVLDATLKN